MKNGTRDNTRPIPRNGCGDKNRAVRVHELRLLLGTAAKGDQSDAGDRKPARFQLEVRVENSLQFQALQQFPRHGSLWLRLDQSLQQGAGGRGVAGGLLDGETQTARVPG